MSRKPQPAAPPDPATALQDLDEQIAKALSLPPAPYSSSMADAWRAQFELKARGFFLYLSDLPSGWEAVYVRANGWDSGPPHRAETAEAAIASAALHAALAWIAAKAEEAAS